MREYKLALLSLFFISNLFGQEKFHFEFGMDSLIINVGESKEVTIRLLNENITEPISTGEVCKFIDLDKSYDTSSTDVGINDGDFIFFTEKVASCLYFFLPLFSL